VCYNSDERYKREAAEMTTKINVATKKKIATQKLIFSVPIIVEFDTINYHSYSPALKGLHMDGDSEKEALENARDTAKEFLEIMIRDGIPIPLSRITRDESKKLSVSKQKEGYYEEEIVINLK
jgi:predicted RNase H-like HicB family nuclease